jgi:predicted phage replisome organizer
MSNGKDYILFYLKLLCESVDHEGNLRFSETIPYNEEMLATITNTNVDVVRSAIKIFKELDMIEIFDNGTYYMKEVKKMMGSETYWAERKRIQRENKNLLETNEIGQCPTCPSKSIDIEKDKDINILLPHTHAREEEDSKPTLDEVIKFCKDNDFKINPNEFFNYYNSLDWKINGQTIKNWKALLRTCEFNPKNNNTSSVEKKPKVTEPDWLKEYEEHFMEGVENL